MDVVTDTERRAVDEPPSSAETSGFARWLVNPLHLVIVLLSFVPPALTLIYVLMNGVNVPDVDQWNNSVPIVLKTVSGTLQFTDLLTQLNEHRFFFTHLITAILTVTTRWNLRVEMMVIFVIACANLLLAAALLWRSDRRAFVLGLIPISALIFSLRQHTSWLLSIQTSWHLIILWFLLLLYVARFARIGWRTLIVCAILGLFMTFTTLHGLLIWPLMLVGFWLLGYRKPGYFALWAAAATISIGLFFYHYNFGIMGADTSGQSAGLVKDPLTIAAYAITYLGNPFVKTENSWALPGAIVGLVGLIVGAANLFYLWRQQRSWRNLIIWVVMAGFSVGAALVTALGRGHIFWRYPAQPLLDRYVTPSLLLWIAFAALMAQVLWPLFTRARLSRWEAILTPVNVLAFILVGALFLYANADSATQPGLMSQAQVDCVAGFPVSRNARCMTRIYLKETPISQVVDAVDQLSIHQLALFADKTPPFDSVTPLADLTGRRVDGDGMGFAFSSQLTPSFSARVFKLPAPGQAEFDYSVPQTTHDIQLRMVAFLSPDAPLLPTIYRVGVRKADGTASLIAEVSYDQTADPNGQPIRVSLDSYKGQAISLILQTRGANGQAVPNALWIDPIIVVVH